VNKGILSFGSPFSSHLLACAWWASYLGVNSIGLVICENNINFNDYPHLKAAEHLGMKLIKVLSTEASNKIDIYREQFVDYFWIPGGGHTKEAAKEYTDLFEQLFLEERINHNITRVVLPFGTGTTAYGIWKSVSKRGIIVIGVSVSRNLDRCIQALTELEGVENFEGLEIIDIYHKYYGRRLSIFEKSRDIFFKNTSILIDPIYNAVAITYLIEKKLNNVLYVNTGGSLNNLL